MKKIISLILSLVMMLSFTACGTKAEATWQEHYDLGLKYVNEAKYEEAILAFTKALEIDPKQQTVYIALAEVYVRQENYTSAQETLDKAITEIGETEELLAEKNNAIRKEKRGTTEKTELYGGGWIIIEYDENGLFTKHTAYYADGSVNNRWINEYDKDGNFIKQTIYNGDGTIAFISEFNKGRQVKRMSYYENVHESTTEYIYADNSPVVTMRYIVERDEGDGETNRVAEFTHTMENPDNEVSVSRITWTADNIMLIGAFEEYSDTGSVEYNCETGVAVKVE